MKIIPIFRSDFHSALRLDIRSNNAENHSGVITFAPNSDHPSDFSLPAQPLGFWCHEPKSWAENKKSIFRAKFAIYLILPISAKMM